MSHSSANSFSQLILKHKSVALTTFISADDQKESICKVDGKDNVQSLIPKHIYSYFTLFLFFFPSGGAAVPVPSKAMLAWVFGTAGSHCAGPGRAKGPSLSSSVIFQIT